MDSEKVSATDQKEADSSVPESVKKARVLATAISDLISDYAEENQMGAAVTVILGQLVALQASLMLLRGAVPLPRGLDILMATAARASDGIVRAEWLKEQRRGAETVQ